MMIVTTKGQTPQELAEEFITAMRNTPSGSKDMDVFFDSLVAREHLPASAKILESIEHVAGSPFNARTLKLFTSLKVKVSDTLLSWVCLQSNGIPAFIETMIGLFAIHFYVSNPRNAKMTLGWVGETVGKGKLVGFRQLMPWHLAAAYAETKTIFDVMTPDDMFTYQEKYLR